MWRAPSLLLFVAVAACTTPMKLVDPGDRTFADRYTVTTDVSWNELKQDGTIVWTNDGFVLQTIRFYAGVKEGESLFKGDETDSPFPEFQSDMQPSEVLEFVADSLGVLGFQQVEPRRLLPEDFGGYEGFVFEMSMLNAEGLQVEAMAFASNRDGRLDLILYMGERSYYFPKYEDAVEGIFASVTSKA